MAWTLRKADTKEVFSDRSFDEILAWAHAAQINPMDELSQDGENWTLASSIPEFEMEWTVLLADGETYGPTNIGTIREFLQVNLLRNDTLAHHIDGTTKEKVKNLINGKWKNKKKKTTEILGAPKPAAPAARLPGLLNVSAPKGGPKIRDFHTQPLPIPAYLRIPPPRGVLLPQDPDNQHHPMTDSDVE